MHESQVSRSLLLGIVLGLTFGSVNLLMTWLDPLADDTPGALLLFYGPMFLAWAWASFRASQRTGQLLAGCVTGLTVAFATFVAYDILIFLRINLFLDALTSRADWKGLIVRFQASDMDSLRRFVNVDYAKAMPLKLAVSCAIGLIMGGAGGIVGKLRRAHLIATA